jgi:hypothetical protein
MNPKKEPALTAEESQQRNREPARKAGAFVSAIVAVLVLYRVLTEEEALVWGRVIEILLQITAPYLTAEFIRGKVMPVDTVKAAGLDPEEVNRDADNPDVEPFVES